MDHAAWITATFFEIAVYSTDQKKPNRERVCERERNGYRTGTRTRTEWVQNGYRTVMERKWNRYRTVMNDKNGRKHSKEHKLREHVLPNTCLGYATRVLTEDLGMM